MTLGSSTRHHLQIQPTFMAWAAKHNWTQGMTEAKNKGPSKCNYESFTFSLLKILQLNDHDNGLLGMVCMSLMSIGANFF